MALAFVAALMGNHPGLEAVDGFDLKEIMVGEEDAEREERTFRMWLTSLGLDLQVISPRISAISPLYLTYISPYLPMSPHISPISPSITSLGPALQIGNLVADCRTGLPLLRVEDHLQPGSVAWKQALLGLVEAGHA
jgi:hypothetical protein